MGAHRAGAPLLTGSVPPLTPFYQARQETGFGLADGLRPGETILLVPAILGTGGTGKTQLAVGFARAMWTARAIDFLVWVPAGSRNGIIASYARAAAEMELPLGDGATADSAAEQFLGWLSRTERRWAVVLDGVSSPVDVDGLWPRGPAGQVIVTSRLRESELADAGANVTAHAVHGFSRREALGYLNTRLAGYPDQRIEALDLAEDLGGLPLSLAQAAAVISVTESTCREYRTEYARRLASTAGTAVEGCTQSLLATWSLSVEHAHKLAPTGLSWTALVFAAALDTSGIPADVLTSPAACGYIAGAPGTGQHSSGKYSNEGADGGEQSLVRSAYANLERLGLVSVDNRDSVRTVWLHSAVRAAVRAYLAPANVEQVVAAAATALAEAWPPPGGPGSSPQLSAALRDSAAALRAFAGDLLWKPDAHPVLIRAGSSLNESPALADSAIEYWQVFGSASSQLLGYGHAHSVLARDRLADAYAASGRLAEALPVFEATLSDREATFGPNHPETVTARLHVARSLYAAGREPEAIALFEQVLRARERLFGPGHREALTVQVQLAAAYEGAGRRGDSIRQYEQAVSDAERELGQTHAETLAARIGLAGAHLAAGQSREAIAGYQRALADQEMAAGADDPATLAVRASLAGAYRVAGKTKEAVGAYERVLADRERVLGADHPDTIAARGNLGYAYRTAGRLKDAIPQYERVIAERERLFGGDHRDTIAARAILGAAYQQARRLREAIATYEQVLADSERVLGLGDVDTLTTRCNLATAYYEAGRMTEGLKVLRRALADCERYLGPDHPMTSTVKESLQAATELPTLFFLIGLVVVNPQNYAQRIGFVLAPMQFDYIIVGGGSAGSALAARLSADATTRVLVLEAGRSDYPWDPFIHMPAALTFPIGSRFYDWKYSSEPEPHLNGRRIYHARGKVLGGSSSINGMIFQRGNPLDYERWAADPGMSSWSYAHCLPYFKRMENCLAAPGTPDAPFRGTDGPLVLERGPAANPLFGAFFEAVQQAGYPLTSDVNGYRQEGFAAFDRNISGGQRLSAARAYLHPAMSRPNLRVVTWAHTTRILFNGTRAAGVEFVLRGDAGVAQVASAPRRAYGGEVIVCAGAFGSPQLLQLSGVGNASELSALGIPVVADLPGVGENLQDHLEVYIQYGSKLPVSVAPYLQWRRRPEVALRWALGRSGPGATNHFEAGGFVRSNDTVRYPNLMFHFLPIAVRYDGSAPTGGHGYQVHIGPMYSDSRGTVKLVTDSPFDKPALRFNYLSTLTDRAEWTEAIAIARRILNQPAFDAFNAGELSPGPSVAAEKEVLEWVARDAETALHPSCTCAMGTGPLSVTDPLSLAVRGVSGLRVVDASVMPYVTNGNIYAPTMMIAEKAADLIMGNAPLAPETIPFYRHESGAGVE